MAFQPKISRARFVYSPFSAAQMVDIGNVMAETIITRIKSGVNAADNQSKALKPGRNGKKGYPDYKMSRGRAPIRDWFFRGLTLGSLKVVRASENSVTIGFVNPQADLIATINNRRELAFAVSPNDKKTLEAVTLATLQQANVVTVRRVA